MRKQTKILLGVGIALYAVVAFLWQSPVLANLLKDEPASADIFRTYGFFASSTYSASFLYATTTSATSTNIVAWFDSNGFYDRGHFVIRGAKRVSMYFSRGGATSANTGSSTFYVEVSPDGTNWYRWNKLVSNVANANSEDLTRVGSVTILASTSTLIYGLDISNDSLYAIRCVVEEVTDGEHACSASAEW